MERRATVAPIVIVCRLHLAASDLRVGCPPDQFVGRHPQEEVMNSTTVVIVVIVVVLVLLALALVAVRKGAERKREVQRGEARDLRERAGTDERKVRVHEAEAAEQEALAREARAEADRKAATADKLQMQADERGEHASATRSEQRDRLRAADDIDPDVVDQERRHDAANTADRPAHGGDARDDRGADGSSSRTEGHRQQPRD